MKLVGIVVSLGYADLLRHALPSVMKALDACYVVTEPGDESAAVAAEFGATPVFFGGWQDSGAAFNKAGAVRLGQARAYEEHPDAWYLVLDADIVLPPGTRDVIESHADNPACIYGASRHDYYTPEALVAGVADKTHDFPLAGYFQLYRPHFVYAAWSASAERCDIDFALMFDVRKLLPLTVSHLGEECKNWRGRVTPLWGSK